MLRVDGMQPRRLGNGRIAADERLLQGVEALKFFGGLRGQDASAMSSAMRAKA